MEEMTEAARIWTAFIRGCTRQHICLSFEIGDILAECIGLTPHDRLVAGELLKADMREDFANHPDFAEINAALETFPKLG